MPGQGSGRTCGPGSLGREFQPFRPGPGERPEGPGAGGKEQQEEEEKEEERADISWRLRPAGRAGPGQPWRSGAEVRGQGTATRAGLGGRGAGAGQGEEELPIPLNLTGGLAVPRFLPYGPGIAPPVSP